MADCAPACRLLAASPGASLTGRWLTLAKSRPGRTGPAPSVHLLEGPAQPARPAVSPGDPAVTGKGSSLHGAREGRPLLGCECQLRSAGVFRVAHRNHARQSGRDLDAVAAIVAVGALSPCSAG
jgi:hypothetical protein